MAASASRRAPTCGANDKRKKGSEQRKTLKVLAPLQARGQSKSPEAIPARAEGVKESPEAISARGMRPTREELDARDNDGLPADADHDSGACGQIFPPGRD